MTTTDMSPAEREILEVTGGACYDLNQTILKVLTEESSAEARAQLDTRVGEVLFLLAQAEKADLINNQNVGRAYLEIRETIQNDLYFFKVID